MIDISQYINNNKTIFNNNYLNTLPEMELQTAEKEEKKQQSKRNKTVITGDLNQLADALPTLELLMKDVSKHQRLEPR